MAGLTYDKLNSTQKNNVALINSALNKYGITNPFFRAGILAVASKESAFIPKSEISYAGTDNSRIRSVFGSRVSSLSDAQLTALKADPKAFFNRVYGGTFGRDNFNNTAPNDGYNYRGRGLNQLTGKSNYKSISDRIGIDLVSSPDKLNDPAVAAQALAIYFLDRFNKGKATIQKKYGVSDINKIDTLAKGTDIAYNLNAGIGNNPASDTTGGYAMAKSVMSSYYNALSTIAKPVGIGLGVIALIGLGVWYFVIRKGSMA
jgi:putative chitinase